MEFPVSELFHSIKETCPCFRRIDPKYIKCKANDLPCYENTCPFIFWIRAVLDNDELREKILTIRNGVI